MRPVDADKLKEWIYEFHPADAYWAISMLENAPTIDDEPIVHAHWIREERTHKSKKNRTIKYHISICSNCGVSVGRYLYPNCPHCRAIMNEVKL